MKNRNLIISLTFCTLVSIAVVSLLFAFSEEIVHRNNSFLRRYPHHPVTKSNALDLGFNSYYIAGKADNKIYLGNVTAPLHALSLSEDLEDTAHIRIELNEAENFQYRAVKLHINEPYFYLTDGSVPVILRGKLGEWKAKPLMHGSAYFSHIEPMTNNSFVIRARRSMSNENEIGKISVKNDTTTVDLAPALLEKQIDGIFDTDGQLLYNENLDKIIYIYYYRNQYIVANPDLSIDYRNRTIDTVTKAQLDIATIASEGKSTLASQALVVNGQSAVSGNYLFVSSERLGKYEPKEMLSQASIIDVYDLKKTTYEFSFYLYNHKRNKMDSFKIFDGQLIAIIDDHIVTHYLKPEYFQLPEKRKPSMIFKKNKN